MLPVLVVVDGHAFALFCTTHGLREWNGYERPGRELFAAGPVTDATRLAELVDSGATRPSSAPGSPAATCSGSTRTSRRPGAGTDGLLTFDQAVVAGREQLSRADRPLQFAIDVAIAHDDWRIEPHPV